MKTRTITVWDAKTDLPEPYRCVVVEDVEPGVGHACVLAYYDPERACWCGKFEKQPCNLTDTAIWYEPQLGKASSPVQGESR